MATLAASAVVLLGATAACAQEVYVRGGLPGAGLGYAQSIGSSVTLRAEYTTLGTRHVTGIRQGVDFDAQVSANQGGAYGDWFPFGGGFRLTVGLSANDVKFVGNAKPNGNGTITINNTTVPFSGADAYTVEVKYPSITPYVGMGWGHQPDHRGWGFVADIGTYVGHFTATGVASPSLSSQLNGAGVNAQSEIDAQTKKIQDELDRYRFLPVVAVGVSYRW
jgi:hypothetical protein